MELARYMKNKIANSKGISYKIRNFLNRKTLTHLYNSFVFPYLIYRIEVGVTLMLYI